MSFTGEIIWRLRFVLKYTGDKKRECSVPQNLTILPPWQSGRDPCAEQVFAPSHKFWSFHIVGLFHSIYPKLWIRVLSQCNYCISYPRLYKLQKDRDHHWSVTLYSELDPLYGMWQAFSKYISKEWVRGNLISYNVYMLVFPELEFHCKSPIKSIVNVYTSYLAELFLRGWDIKCCLGFCSWGLKHETF